MTAFEKFGQSFIKVFPSSGGLRKEYALNLKAVRKPQVILGGSPKGKNKLGGRKPPRVPREFPL